ncbi:hypothetical protein CPB86DRAFT_573608 [Serendipita vermifera]|nr:hypothetical protein CPB86DRAFT_573608 [Serendipita vermifera]
MAATLADTANFAGQLAAAAAATTGTPQLASPPAGKKETLRSERMLRDMLVKDGAARSRSLSRGSSTAAHVPSSTRQPAPPLPNQVHAPTPVLSNGLVRNSSGSGNSNASSSDERPMFVSSGPGGSLAMLFNPGVGSGSGSGSSSNTRPHLPTPRKTYDGATVFATAATSDRCASPPPAVRHFTAPPGTLIHTHSSPIINQKHSSGCNSSHPPGTPSSSFNIESASEFCRQQQGYVSFGDIQGLGRPAGEEEEERLERERLEMEMRRKKGWWSWIEDGLISRPKTPGHE